MNRYYFEVAERAKHRCEYCQAPEVVFNFPFEVEHIVPISRQGTNNVENLALACRSCNLRKGNRISGCEPNSDVEVPYFHPREDQWNQHFRVDVESGSIVGLTDIGRVTTVSLEMDSPPQVTARRLWIRLGLFP